MKVKLEQQDIDRAIAKEEYVVFGGRLTVCVLTLNNGFMVTGESSCVSEETFDAAIGREIALTAAQGKVWELEGYTLRNKLFNHNKEQ